PPRSSPWRDSHPGSPPRPPDRRPIDPADLRPGSHVLDRVSGLDGHGHTHPPGRPGGSVGGVGFRVRRSRAGSGIGQRERRVDAVELVFAALITGDDPRSVTAGGSAGVPYTPRAQNSNGSAFAEDITSSAAGAQQGTATCGAAANWLAVCAVFHAAPATAPQPPSTPAGLEATSVASTRVALSWSPSSGSVAGYG